MDKALSLHGALDRTANEVALSVPLGCAALSPGGGEFALKRLWMVSSAIRLLAMIVDCRHGAGCWA